MFENTIVNKPWGYEYLVYENENVGIWYLNINYNARTSLHAHPNKKTGLIVLSGAAEISFLNHTHKLIPPDKTMIRHGVFHSTRAVSKQGVEILEVETPKDKYDLIRLEDYYGRAGQPYEDSSHYDKNPNIFATLINSKRIQLGDCELQKDNYILFDKFHTIIILEGGMTSEHYPVLSCGDIVDNTTIVRLSDKFDTIPSKVIGLKY